MLLDDLYIVLISVKCLNLPKWCDLSILMNLFECVKSVFTDCAFPVTKMHAIWTNRTLGGLVDYSDNNRSFNRTCKPKIVRKKNLFCTSSSMIGPHWAWVALKAQSGLKFDLSMTVWLFLFCLTSVFRKIARWVLLDLGVRLRPNNTPQFYRFGSNEPVGPRKTQRVCWTLSGCYWD